MEKNINAAKELLANYKAITLDQIIKIHAEITEQEDIIPSGYDIMEKLTGFSSVSKCMLCQEAQKLANNNHNFCKYCIYINSDEIYDYYSCVNETYKALGEAYTPEKIYDALQDRIEFLEQSIVNYESQL